MNFSFLIQRVSDLENLPVNVVKRVLQRSFSEISTTLIENESVKLKSFGTFKPTVRKARIQTIPSGRKIKLKAARRVSFTISKTLKKGLQ